MVRFLEWRAGETRHDVRCPEALSEDPPVDLRFWLGVQGYAIEHTRIEAFEDQIAGDAQFCQLIGPVKSALSGTLPGDAVYELVLPIETGFRKEFTTLREAQCVLIAWVREIAASLHAKDAEDPSPERRADGAHRRVSGTPPGFPYEVTLYRGRLSHPTRYKPGSLVVARFAPEDLRCGREARLRRALQDKCPKLYRCRAGGARTVLVLENNDLPLSNAIDILEALAPALDERGDAPHEIYLVETVSDSWFVHLIKDEAGYWPLVAGRTMKFSEGDLVDLSGVAKVARESTEGS